MMDRPTRAAQAFLLAIGIVAGSAGAFSQVPGGGPPRTLTIDQAVELALERNLSVALSQSQVETSSARVTGAFGAFLPQISVNSGYAKQLSDDPTVIVQGIPIQTGRPDYSYDASAGASLVLFDGFNRTANYSNARASFDASLQSLARTRQDVSWQARSAFLNALRAEQLIEIREADLELAGERLAQNRELVNAGAAQIGVVYSQEAEVANAELSLEQARTDALIARNNLQLLLNYDPAAQIQLSSEGLANSIDSAEILRTRGQFGTLETMLESQRRTRADLQAARLRVEAAKSSVTVARSGYYPTISTSLGWYWQKAGATDGSANTQFGLNFQFTPFDGFRTSEQVELAEAQRQSAEIELRRLELDARSQLQQAIARLEGAERQLRAAEKAVAAARQSRYASDERFRLGAGSYSDYLLANNQYLTAQINQVNAVFNYRMAIFEIRYQMGE